MTNESFSSDDDLFGYDPSQESLSPSINPINTNLDHSNSDIFQDISKRIDSSKDSDLIGSFTLKIRFAQSLLASYSDFVKPNSVFFHKSVHQTLDKLTNGNFSFIYMYNYLEQNIIRRLHIKYLIETSFLSSNDFISLDFQSFLSKIGLDIDSTFIQIHIKTNIDINNHILNNERSLYMNLAEKLSFTPHFLIDNPEPNSTEIYQSIPDNIQAYHETLYESIFMSLADSDYTDKLSELYLNPVRLSQL